MSRRTIRAGNFITLVLFALLVFGCAAGPAQDVNAASTAELTRAIHFPGQPPSSSDGYYIHISGLEIPMPMPIWCRHSTVVKAWVNKVPPGQTGSAIANRLPVRDLRASVRYTGDKDWSQVTNAQSPDLVTLSHEFDQFFGGCKCAIIGAGATTPTGKPLAIFGELRPEHCT